MLKVLVVVLMQNVTKPFNRLKVLFPENSGFSYPHRKLI